MAKLKVFFNVRYLKTNSGKKGKGMPVVRNAQFYFKEGFCWTDVSKENIKCRKKGKTIFDVLSMCLFSKDTKYPDEFFISIINSVLLSNYVNNFINASVHFQINDARMLPIIIPTQEELNLFISICKNAYNIKVQESQTYSSDELKKLEKRNNELVNQVYNL